MTETLYHFSQRVDNYIKYRPHYPKTVLELLQAECQLASTYVIADVGSGTGILSELFLKIGLLTDIACFTRVFSYQCLHLVQIFPSNNFAPLRELFQRTHR